MKTVIIDYATISPAVLANIVEKAFDCFCNWSDIDEDFFKFSVYDCSDLAGLEKILARYA
jgi:hypothetical protein